MKYKKEAALALIPYIIAVYGTGVGIESKRPAVLVVAVMLMLLTFAILTETRKEGK